MNIIKKTKLLKCFIKLGNIMQKQYKANEEIVKDALWFFGSCFKDARPYIEKIKDILKND